MKKLFLEMDPFSHEDLLACAEALGLPVAAGADAPGAWQWRSGRAAPFPCLASPPVAPGAALGRLDELEEAARGAGYEVKRAGGALHFDDCALSLVDRPHFTH